MVDVEATIGVGCVNVKDRCIIGREERGSISGQNNGLSSVSIPG